MTQMLVYLCNVISKRRYTGVNTLLLGMIRAIPIQTLGYFQTMAKSLGGSVKRGEMGTRIVFYKPIKRQQKNAEGKIEEVLQCTPKYRGHQLPLAQ